MSERRWKNLMTCRNSKSIQWILMVWGANVFPTKGNTNISSSNHWNSLKFLYFIKFLHLRTLWNCWPWSGSQEQENEWAPMEAFSEMLEFQVNSRNVKEIQWFGVQLLPKQRKYTHFIFKPLKFLWFCLKFFEIPEHPQIHSSAHTPRLLALIWQPTAGKWVSADEGI